MNTDQEDTAIEQNFIIKKKENCIVEQMDWGSLTWFASHSIGNSNNATIGYCVIKAGYTNYKHLHTNCEEILNVLEGSIVHTIGDSDIAMQKGDTITIPPNVRHCAKNIGKSDAVLLVYFSSPNRLTITE